MNSLTHPTYTFPPTVDPRTDTANFPPHTRGASTAWFLADPEKFPTGYEPGVQGGVDLTALEALRQWLEANQDPVAPAETFQWDWQTANRLGGMIGLDDEIAGRGVPTGWKWDAITRMFIPPAPVVKTPFELALQAVFDAVEVLKQTKA